MNTIALIHIISGIIVVAVDWPLSRRKIRMNAIYGFRIDAAFESDQLWYDINAYGGRMFIRWGPAIILTGLIGILLPSKFWTTYAFVALIIIIGGLSISVCKTLQYADR